MTIRVFLRKAKETQSRLDQNRKTRITKAEIKGQSRQFHFQGQRIAKIWN